MWFDIIMNKIQQRHFVKKYESSALREAGKHSSSGCIIYQVSTTKPSSQHYFRLYISSDVVDSSSSWGTTTDHRTWLQSLHPPCHLVAHRLHSASVPLWAICTLISSEQCYSSSNYSTSRIRTLNSKLCVHKLPFLLEMCLYRTSGLYCVVQNSRSL